MSSSQRIALLLLRLALGWLFFYTGIIKVLNHAWSAAGYLQGAKHLSGFYHFLLQPQFIHGVSVLNVWGLTLIGAALILGIFMRLSCVLGIVLMALYYLVLPLPHPDANSYLVDEHWIYALCFLALLVFDAGRVWGLGRIVGRLGSWAK